jgi:membrane protease YdiL (CAAX protease family)
MTAPPETPLRPTWWTLETLALAWIGGALILAMAVPLLLDAAMPFFTFIWLLVPLGVLLRSRYAGFLGIRRVPWRDLLPVVAINLALWWLLMALFEPWTHIYRDLVREAMSGASPDTTFGWLERYPGAPGWIGLALYSGLVTLFAEELFFRGWLLQVLDRKMKTVWAVVLQAVLFSLPQALVMFVFPPLQGVIWTVVYAFLAVGVVGGWAAARTRSIWPSLIAATLTNLLLTALVLR